MFATGKTGFSLGGKLAIQFQLDVVGIFEIIGDKPSEIRTSAV